MGETESHIASIRVADRWMCHHKVWKPDPTLILTKKKIMEFNKNLFLNHQGSLLPHKSGSVGPHAQQRTTFLTAEVITALTHLGKKSGDFQQVLNSCP